MSLLTERNLEKLATEVVDAYFGQQVPLTETVVKVAERENFNPEQIKRLVEAANNMAFQRKFSQAEGPDRMDASEFETANPNAAIQRLIAAAKDVMNEMGDTGSACPSCAGDLSQDLPVTRPDVTPLNPAGPEDNLTPVGEPKISGTVVIMKLRKTAELLRDEQMQHRCEFTDAFQKLATFFTRLHSPEFEAFEKDAFYKWGERAVPYLQMLRGALRKEAAVYDHTAMTKVARVIDSSQPSMQLLRTTMEHSEAVALAEKGLEKVNSYLDKLA